MESEAKNLVIILGPTGVGKTALSVRLANKIGGEIINCDSMQVYMGFDIGTDKIPPEKREGIPHHLLDVVEPSIQFTAADFVKLSLKTIRAILEQKKVPLIVGGTGLYIRALVEGLFPEGKSAPRLRQKLEEEARKHGLEKLRERLMEIDPDYGRKIGPNDKVRIIRALEVFHSTGKPISRHFDHTRSAVEDFNIVKIGLKLERHELYRRIEERTDQMVKKGLVQEVERLLREGVDEKSPPFRALGYKYALKHLRNEISLDQAIALTKRDTRRYAKRQMTWFRKMKGIRWYFPSDFSSILEYVEKNLR